MEVGDVDEVLGENDEHVVNISREPPPEGPPRARHCVHPSQKQISGSLRLRLDALQIFFNLSSKCPGIIVICAIQDGSTVRRGHIVVMPDITVWFAFGMRDRWIGRWFAIEGRGLGPEDDQNARSWL